MANDRLRRNMFASHFERLMQNDKHPSSIINLGLGGLSLFEDDEGAVASYDIKLHDEDGRAGRISNRSFNTIHRLLEAYGDTILGHREVMRSLKIQRHNSMFPAAFYSFVETFSDTKFTDDANGECVFNGVWSPPTTNPPVDPDPVSSAAFAITGALEHNAYEGSITHLSDDTITASAGTYRTLDLLSTGITQGLTPEDYWLPNHYDKITAINLFNATGVTPVWTDIDNVLDEGTLLIVTAHANNAFWDGYWDTDDPADTDITPDQTHISKNRITIYPYEASGGIDASKKLIYYPHVPATTTYAPTQTSDPNDNIFGKILNVEESIYKPNEGRHYSSGSGVHPINISSGAIISSTSTISEVELTVPLIAVIKNSDSMPSGFINDNEELAGGILDIDTFGVASALRVDITLGPNAKLYSFGIHAVRARDWAMSAASGKHLG